MIKVDFEAAVIIAITVVIDCNYRFIQCLWNKKNLNKPNSREECVLLWQHLCINKAEAWLTITKMFHRMKN
jgi:hypothetical protein